jgi:hypothetical protein
LTKRRLVAAALFAFSMLVWSATGGRISGTITDEHGVAISGVHVVVTNTAQGIQTKTTSDAKGTYSFPTLPVGRYNLTADAPGFTPQTRRDLALHVDGKLQVDLMLKVIEKTER